MWVPSGSQYSRNLERSPLKDGIVFKELSRKYALLFDVYRWCASLTPMTILEWGLSYQRQGALKVLMTCLWAQDRFLLDTLSTEHDHKNTRYWFDKVMTLCSLLISSHQTYAVTSWSHKEHQVFSGCVSGVKRLDQKTFLSPKTVDK